MVGEETTSSLLAPLRHTYFRRIWSASLLSNLGMLINGVGAGWAMVEMGGSADKVALVQTSMMIPFMVLALPAGAISDTYDRRVVGIVSAALAILSSLALFLIAQIGLLTPTSLLAMGVLIGAANALFAPVWISSVGELVPREHLPQGIALNAMSFNIARAFGPALGGFLVALWGAVAAFAANAIAFVPMLVAQLAWKREREKPRLPPEQLWTATVAGVRYVFHTPPVRRVIARALLFGIAAGAINALMPLIARDLLHGGPQIYGVLLGCFGVGAVSTAPFIDRVRRSFTAEVLVSGNMAIMGLALVALSFTTIEVIAYAIMIVAGMNWMLITNSLAVSIQTRAPRWVVGRAVAAFQATISGGLGFGAVIWGSIAVKMDTQTALWISGTAILLNAALGRILPVAPTAEQPEDMAITLSEPDVALELKGRSGPILIFFEYDVPVEDARNFHFGINAVRKIRSRNGAYGWSVSRDIADGRLWTERFFCQTWHDYLRMRTRMTEEERHTIGRLVGDPVRIRRHLDRPSGSVRWTDDTPDRGIDISIGPAAGPN